MNYFVIFGIIIGTFVASFVLSARVMKTLRTRHPGTWEALGRPRRINIADRTSPEAENFWTRGYKELNDTRFESQVEQLKTFNIIFGLIAIAMMVLMVVKLLMGSR